LSKKDVKGTLIEKIVDVTGDINITETLGKISEVKGLLCNNK
jgi:hypothetical protein